MGYTVEIAGSPVAVEVGSATFSRDVQRRTFTCTVLSVDGSLEIEEFDEVEVTRDGEGSPCFGGFVSSVEKRGIFGADSIDELAFEIECTDYGALAERRVVFLTLPAGTLKAAMQALQPYLDVWGVTVHGSQVDGPSLEAITWEGRRLNECIADLTTWSGGYLSSISASKVWRMALAGSADAAFDVADGNGVLAGELRVRRSKGTGYANRVIVRGGTGTALDNYTQVFTQAGSEVEYQCDRDASQNINDTYPNVVIVDGVVVAPAGWGPDQLPAGNWYWDYVNAKMVNGTGVPLSPGEELTVTFAQSPWVVSEDVGEQAAPVGIIETIRDAPTATTYAQTKAAADAVLDALMVEKTSVVYPTESSGLEVGDSQTINCSARGVTGEFTVVSIEESELPDGRLHREVMAILGTAGVGESWRDVYDEWSGGGSSGGGSVTVVSGGGGGGTGGASIYPLAHGVNEIAHSDWAPASAFEAVIDTSSLSSLAGKVYVRLRARDAGISVTARLRNVTDGVTCGTGSVVTSTSWTPDEFNITLASGKKTYRLELLPSAAGKNVAASGYLEVR